MKSKNQALEESIQKLSEEKLRTLLLEVACHDDSIADQILFDPSIGREQEKYIELESRVRQLIKELDELTDDYLKVQNDIKNGEYFQEYQKLYKHLLKQHNKLDQDKVTETLVRNEFYNLHERANNINFKISKIISYLEIDQTNPEALKQSEELIKSLTQSLDENFERSRDINHTFFAQSISKFYIELYKLIEDQTLRKQFIENFKELFINENNQNRFSALLAKHILKTLLNEKEYLQTKLQRLDTLLKKEESDKIVVQRLELMKQLEYSQKDIDVFKLPYRSELSVLEFEIDDLLNRQQWSEAEQSIQELLISYSEIDPKPYYLALNLIYDKTGQIAKRVEILRNLILKTPQENLEYILSLKSLLQETEWDKFKKELKLTISNFLYMDLLVEENNQEELFDMLLPILASMDRNGKIIDTSRYEKFLMNSYGEELCDEYIRKLKSEMDRAQGRKDYTRVIAKLSHLTIYPDGDRIRDELIGYWCKAYPRRRAMREEITNSGYTLN